jgi:hypothetical protein
LKSRKIHGQSIGLICAIRLYYSRDFSGVRVALGEALATFWFEGVLHPELKNMIEPKVANFGLKDRTK